MACETGRRASRAADSSAGRERELTRARATVTAGLVAGLAANYWVLGLLVSGPSAPVHGWISDLGARGAPHEGLFAVLDSLSGVAIVVLAALLWRPLAGHSRALRLGLLALGLAGALSVLDGAVPLSCGRSLDPTCALEHDTIDAVHTVESIVAVVVTLLAFWLVGVGLRRERDLRAIGNLTLALGAIWLLLSALLVAKYATHDLASVKGLAQRGGQIVLGVWLAALGLLGADARAQPGPPRGTNEMLAARWMDHTEETSRRSR